MFLRPPQTSMLGTIGSTPLVELTKIVPSGSARVLVKLECLNPTGSYKDRMALAVIEEAEKRGDLRPGMTVVEYTGGSTGASLAFVCAVKGYRFRVVSSDAFAQEKLRMMSALGAELTIIPSHNGEMTRDLFQSMIEQAKIYAMEENTYFTDQFNNRDVLTGYAALAAELLEQAEKPIHTFCAAVGTAGMLMGAARQFRASSPSTRIIALEPSTSAVISTGVSGKHYMEGMGVGFVPPLLDRALLDEIRVVDEEDARAMARRLAAEEGLLVGTSSGGNIASALKIAGEIGAGHIVTTVAVDTGLKYLNGDLYQ